MHNIYIVEDTETDRQILEHIISAEFNVTTFESVEDFVAADVDKDEVDLILTDLNFSGSSGRTCVHWAKERRVPVIVLSGSSDRDTEVEMLTLGVSDFIRKPYSPEIVLHRVRLQVNLHKQHKQIQKANDQLVQSEKMAALGQLAAGVAHEINNPVGFITTNNNMIKKYVEKIENAFNDIKTISEQCQDTEMLLKFSNWQASHKLEFILEDLVDLVGENEEGLGRVKEIVKDLKEYSHLGELKFESYDLSKLLTSAVNLLRNEIKYKAKVEYDFADDSIVECIFSQLNQVFVNIIVNACHAIEDQGTIKVSTRGNSESVVIHIEDDGKGIEPEKLKYIFNPFFTTKPVGQGTGLGLAISKTIIERHHGEIFVKSKVGKGTQFEIVLPRKQPEDSE